MIGQDPPRHQSRFVVVLLSIDLIGRGGVLPRYDSQRELGAFPQDEGRSQRHELRQDK